MAEVQDVEAAVREHDRAALRAQPRRELGGLRARRDLLVRARALRAELGQDLLTRDRGGAELPDLHTRRDVREPGSLGDLGAGGERERDGRRHHIARARHVHQLARSRGNLEDRAHAVSRAACEQHARLAARDERVRDVELRRHAQRSGRDVVDAREANARECRRLAQVRLDHRRAAIDVPRQALRIDDHGATAGRRDRRAAHRGREHALRVVGDDQRVGFAHGGDHARAQPLLERGRERGDRLAVQANHLLVTRDDARLARREAFPVGQDSRRRNAEIHRLAAEQRAVRVLADDRAQARARAERDQRLRDVRGAAEHELLALDGEHGHGRFRRDPLDLADHVRVERGVADHDHAAADHGAEQLAHTRDRRLAEFSERRLTRSAATHSPLPRYLYQIRAISKKPMTKSSGRSFEPATSCQRSSGSS